MIDRLGGYQGGVQRARTLKICVGMGSLAFVCAVALIFATHIEQFVPLLWCLLFFGGTILPGCSGIVISIVPKKHRAVSSAIAMLVFNLLGYFLSLTLSGYIMQVSESE